MLVGLRWYLLASTGLNLLWEIVQLPLYTLWQNGTTSQISIAILHCTAGDMIIASTTLVLALVLLNQHGWPTRASPSLKMAVALAGLAYTIFSERMNLANGGWAYSELMPVVPWLDVGLSPVLQWLFVPVISLWYAEKRVPRG